MNSKILLVDDDPNVLAGYRRQLRKSFQLETAGSGQEALEVLARNGPFAVVISDMRMPGMNGIELLSEVRRQSPETVRMMLTGNADLQTSVDAVNQGHIFRFLTKPCSPEDFNAALEAALEQHRLIMAERNLLHGTLTGCIRTLTDVLGLMSPAAFSRSTRIRRYVRHIAAQLNLPHFWEYETAAMLSQIGCVALPPEILARMREGRSLTTEQRGILARHPAYGCQLLAEIPRLEMVAQVVGRQNNASRKRIIQTDGMSEEQAVEFGGQLLRIALDLDNRLQRSMSYIEALAELHEMYGPDHPLLEALMSYEKDRDASVSMQITAGELSAGMVAADDILTNTGHVLVSKGQPITDAVRIHLQSCAEARGLREPFLVEVSPAADR